MQRKNQTHIKKERYTRDYLMVEGSLAENVKNLVLMNSISWNCIQYIFISRCAIFRMR